MRKRTHENISHGESSNTNEGRKATLDRMLNLVKVDGALSSSVRFEENGSQHSVEIRVPDDVAAEDAKLALRIDGAELLETKTKWRLSGNFEFCIEGMGVYFSWDLSEALMKFSFHTKACDESQSILRAHASCYTTWMVGWNR